MVPRLFLALRANVRQECRTYPAVLIFIMGLTALLTSYSAADAEPARGAIPRAARKYLPQVVREAHYRNLDAANLAGQIHQESGWDISAASPYAAGLAQFTPETEAWARAAFSQLRGGAGSSDPRWAIRAMCAYDRWLMDRVDQRYADALRAYNGGLGYIIKERGCAPQTPPQSSPFQGEVREGFACCRKFRSVAACKENLEYPVRIMTIHAPMYRRIINPYSEAQS